MKIGFVTIFAWRPHVEHMHYLAKLTRQAGHEVCFLSCDRQLDACYALALGAHRSRRINCIRCQMGGVRSFESNGVSALDLRASSSSDCSSLSEWCESSAATLWRFESSSDLDSVRFHETVNKLAKSAKKVYYSARKWIDKEKIDAVCLFNGRIDMTRAVLEATKDSGIPHVSMERTWFGDGIQLYPSENCLGLKNIRQFMQQWRSRPLTKQQALLAAKLVASRFLRSNQKEWRAYNIAAEIVPWPDSHAQRRVLLVPGSRNEFWGHPDWAIHWSDRTEGFDAVIDKLNLQPGEVLLRCHPNWGETIGKVGGERIEQHYIKWAKKRNIPYIASKDKTSTLGLIEQSDAIVVCGGSSALEAGALGKQVIAIGPSTYDQAGFQTNADNPLAIESLTLRSQFDSDKNANHIAITVARLTLRFAYTMAYRLPQYVNYVRCQEPTLFTYYKGADPERFLSLMRGDPLQADDNSYAMDIWDEDRVLEMIQLRNWKGILSTVVEESKPYENLQINRRWLFRPLDWLRNFGARGDR